MSVKSRKFRNIDRKNIIIGVLALAVVIEAFFLLARPFKTITIIEKTQEPAVEYKEPELKQTPESIVGYIAIIIDDWGYNSRLCNALSDIDIPLAVSILPSLKQSSRIAQCAYRYGKTIMVHLPLEPHSMHEKYPEDYVIETSMEEKKIRQILKDAIDSVPYTAGINNHMGSKATEDPHLMRIIFSELKDGGLFFADSLVTSNSVCSDLAHQMRLPFAKRDVFIDNESERSYIEGQLEQLAKKAKRKGFALGIGHARRLTLQIIREQIPLLEKQGFQFISVKDLIELQK